MKQKEGFVLRDVCGEKVIVGIPIQQQDFFPAGFSKHCCNIQAISIT